jgi:hypothetical protein
MALSASSFDDTPVLLIAGTAGGRLQFWNIQTKCLIRELTLLSPINAITVHAHAEGALRAPSLGVKKVSVATSDGVMTINCNLTS